MAALEAGSLIFRMAADVAQIKSDMDKARAIMGDGVNEMVGMIKKVAVAYAGIASVDAFKDMVLSSIKAADALGQLSLKTGASVESLSALAAVGKLTGTSADQIGDAMNKMSKNLASVDEDGKGAASALRSLGINFNDFKKLTPDQQMKTVADAMDGFADGSGKSVIAMQLFGKSGAELLPLLKELAQQHELNAKLTTEQAEQAKEFDNNLKALTASGDAWKKQLAMGLLPAMNDITKVVMDLFSGTGGLKDQVKQLAADGTLAEWARGAAIGLSYVVDVGQGLFSIIPMIGKLIAGVAAASAEWMGGLFEAFNRLKSGDVSGAFDAVKAGFRAVGSVAVSTGQDIGAVWSQELLGQKFRDRLKDVNAITSAIKEQKPQLDANNNSVKKHAEAIDKARQAGVDWIANLDKVAAALQMEEDLGRKLTKAEQERLDLEDKLKTGKIKLTDSEIAHAQAVIATNASIQSNIDWQKQAKSENDKAAEAIAKTTDKLQGQVKAQQDVNDKIGATPEQLVAIQIASLETQRQEALRMADATIGGDDVRKSYLGQAEAFGQLQTKVKDGVVLKAAAEAASAWKTTVDGITNGLTNGLMQAFESGKGFAKAFRDMLVNAFKTLVLQPAINFIVSPITGAVTSALSGLFGTGLSAAGSGVAAAGAGVGAAGAGAALLGGAQTALQFLGSPVALGLAALALLDTKSTPHMGGYSLADASGNVSDITSAMGGKQNSTTQQTTNALAGTVSALLNKTAGAFGLTPNLSVRSVFEADNKDAAEALFHILSSSGAKVAGFDQTTNSTLAPDAATAYGQYTSMAAGSVKSAIQNLGLPDWALAEFNQLGAGATIDDIAAVAQRVIDEQNAKKNPTTPAAGDAFDGPLLTADPSPMWKDMAADTKRVAEAAEALSTKAATADGQDTSLTTMAEGFKQAVTQLQMAVERLASLDSRAALQASRGVTG